MSKTFEREQKSVAAKVNLNIFSFAPKSNEPINNIH